MGWRIVLASDIGDIFVNRSQFSEFDDVLRVRALLESPELRELLDSTLIPLNLEALTTLEPDDDPPEDCAARRRYGLEFASQFSLSMNRYRVEVAECATEPRHRVVSARFISSEEETSIPVLTTTASLDAFLVALRHADVASALDAGLASGHVTTLLDFDETAWSESRTERYDLLLHRPWHEPTQAFARFALVRRDGEFDVQPNEP